MSQRNSEYKRIPLDKYETLAWVTFALVPHLPLSPLKIWEPAAGSGKMVRALEAAGYSVTSSDIENGGFLKARRRVAEAIVTNPPYTLATEFIERALDLMRPCHGIVAMLLRTDFDHAVGRKHLFGQCRSFKKKIILTRRVRWFEGSKGSPSFNHAWYVWDYNNYHEPVIKYDFQS